MKTFIFPCTNFSLSMKISKCTFFMMWWLCYMCSLKRATYCVSTRIMECWGWNWSLKTQIPERPRLRIIKGTRFGPIWNSGLRPCLGPFTCIWITFGLRPGRLRSIPKYHNTWIAPWYLGVLFFYVSIIVSSQLVIITVPLGWFPMDPFGPWSLQVQTVIFVASILSDASRPS